MSCPIDCYRTSLRALATSVIVFVVWGISVTPVFPQDTKNIARGRREFVQYCAVCHGKDARGDGPVVRQLGIDPADLTQVRKKNGGQFPFWETYEFIDGRGQTVSLEERPMPIWGNEFRKEMSGDSPNIEQKVKERILNIVHYLETIQKR